jgi:hypothetical protein
MAQIHKNFGWHINWFNSTKLLSEDENATNILDIDLYNNHHSYDNNNQ